MAYYPTRTYIHYTTDGSPAFLLKFYARELYLCEDGTEGCFETDGSDSPCIYPDYECSISLDIYEFPSIRLILERQLLNFDIPDSEFDKRVSLLQREILKSIPNVSRYFFPKELLSQGELDIEKYELYQKIKNNEKGFSVKEKILVPISATCNEYLYSFMQINWEREFEELNKEYVSELTKMEYEYLLRYTTQDIQIEYVNSLQPDCRYYRITDIDYLYRYDFYVVVCKSKPLLLFITRSQAR